MCLPLLSLCHEGEWYGVPIMLLSFPQAQTMGQLATEYNLQNREPTQSFPLLKLIACGILIQSRTTD